MADDASEIFSKWLQSKTSTKVQDKELGTGISTAQMTEFLRVLSDQKRKEAPTLASPVKAALLQDYYVSLNVNHPFLPGRLVKWKRGLKNKLRPEMDEPAVVLEVFDEVRYDDSQPIASPYHKEPLSVRLGVIDNDQDFISYLFDGRRFEPW